MKKIIFFLVFLCYISIVYSVVIDVNSTDIPVIKTYNQTIERNHNTTLYFKSNVSWMTFDFNPINLQYDNEINFTSNIINFNLNNSFTSGNYSARLLINDSITSELLYIDYYISIHETIDLFMQIDPITYVFNLKTHEIDDPFRKIISITVYGEGQAYVVCSSWITCNPYTFNLTNSTISYDLNITTEAVSEGTYKQFATFFLIDKNNKTRLVETNISFIFNVEFEPEPIKNLNEVCNPINMTFSAYQECVSNYYKAVEESIRQLNQTKNVTVYVENRSIEYREVIPWLHNNTDDVIQELLDLKEIDRVLKSQTVENKKLQTQLLELQLSNENLSNNYFSLINNIPTITRDMVASLVLELQKQQQEKASLSKNANNWIKMRKGIIIFVVIFFTWSGYFVYTKINPFWGG